MEIRGAIAGGVLSLSLILNPISPLLNSPAPMESSLKLKNGESTITKRGLDSEMVIDQKSYDAMLEGTKKKVFVSQDYLEHEYIFSVDEMGYDTDFKWKSMDLSDLMKEEIKVRDGELGYMVFGDENRLYFGKLKNTLESKTNLVDKYLNGDKKSKNKLETMIDDRLGRIGDLGGFKYISPGEQYLRMILDDNDHGDDLSKAEKKRFGRVYDDLIFDTQAGHIIYQSDLYLNDGTMKPFLGRMHMHTNGTTPSQTDLNVSYTNAEMVVSHDKLNDDGAWIYYAYKGKWTSLGYRSYNKNITSDYESVYGIVNIEQWTEWKDGSSFGCFKLSNPIGIDALYEVTDNKKRLIEYDAAKSVDVTMRLGEGLFSFRSRQYLVIDESGRVSKVSLRAMLDNGDSQTFSNSNLPLF